ncbi:MAG: hypothetical protein R3C28_10940 [Pirellulaceae bacterium]
MDSIRLFDVGGDGDLDLIATTDEFAFLFRNEDGDLIQQEQHADRPVSVRDRF